MSTQNTSTPKDEPLSLRARAAPEASQARGAAIDGPGDQGQLPALPPDKPGDADIAGSAPATHRLAGAPGRRDKPLRFLVVGAGAVGGLIAARLTGAGYDVTVLALPRSASRLREGGLRIASQDATSVLRPAVVTAAELTPRYDAIVLAVKSEDLGGAMADIEPAVKPPAVIIPFLNGMAHVEALTGRFGSAVLGGVLRIATQLEADGTIRVLTPQFDVELGELDGSPSARVDRLASAFKDAGADVAVPGNIVDAMWAKWVFIASLGAVTSLMRATVGDIAAAPGGQRFARTVLTEAAAAAAACSHPVPAGQLRVTEDALTAAGSPATSSLTRDLIAGRRTEVEAVLADLAARARTAGTATPLIDLAVLALRIHNRQIGS
jgi:2-dehydropantoate 2-reductase